MTGFEAIPLEMRLAMVFALGACIGGALHAAADRLGYRAAGSSPWSCTAGSPGRTWLARLPVVGWLAMAGRRPMFGRASWFGPMLVELALAVGFAWLYWWEIERQGVLFGNRAIANPDLALQIRLHAVCAAHLALLAFMTLASLVDVREKLIPDAVTVPGTLFGLTLAAAYPDTLLPVLQVQNSVATVEHLTAASPQSWRPWLSGQGGLILALACWLGWCFALLPRVWYPRHGLRRAFVVFWAHLVRIAATWRIAVMGAAGAAAIAAVWQTAPANWVGLSSSLLGLAVAAGLVWLIRIVGTRMLRREAMGFGDVTLMAMIGAFLGWQASVIAFFLAPLGALIIGLIILAARRETEIAYGPFLCLGAVVTIVRWSRLWVWGAPLFALGRYLLLVFLACMLVLTGLLAVVRAVKSFWQDTTH